MKRIVGLTGLAGSGKSTVARHLEENLGFTRLPFAAPLKAMLRAAGLTLEHTDGPLKEEPCQMLCGKTPREAMQTLGTEWGRKLIGNDVWCALWQHSAKELVSKGGYVVADDVRFPNEVELIRSMGGMVLNIQRPDIKRGSHESETHDLESDHVLVNDSTRAALLDTSASLVASGGEALGRCISVELGCGRGTGYVVGLLENGTQTEDVNRATHFVLRMISGPWIGMDVTTPIVPEALVEPTYH